MKSIKRSGRNRKVFIGKYLLDSISLGMYDDPLMVIREYIQNSTDSLDKQYTAPNTNRGQIYIDINGREKSIQIKDNGTGLLSKVSKKMLTDLGISQKKHTHERGFRGIGRLGGLGYCDELRFVTKASCESVVSTIVWDCTKLRQLINEKSPVLDLASLVDAVVTCKVDSYKGHLKDHYFTVEMINVNSSKDMLLNVPAVKSYIAQVAPVPFNSNYFKFSKEIHRALLKHVPAYQVYNIFVNGQKVYKPYLDQVSFHQGFHEDILKIEFIKISDEPLAFGWLANTSLKGGIDPSSLVDCIRVRCGNMQIGNKQFLSEYFRETRFGSYMLGEIHIIDPRIIPNSRRDNFEDSKAVDQFICCFIKDIGLPFSKEIRQRSSERSRLNQLRSYHLLESQITKIAANGYYSELQKVSLLHELNKKNNQAGICSLDNSLELVNRLNSAVHILETGKYNFSRNICDILTAVFDAIYQGSDNKATAEKISHNILNKLPLYQLKH